MYRQLSACLRVTVTEIGIVCNTDKNVWRSNRVKKNRFFLVSLFKSMSFDDDDVKREQFLISTVETGSAQTYKIDVIYGNYFCKKILLFV